MPADVFVDTNIFVYAHDRDAGARHVRARELVESAWRDEPWPYLSVQVLQELFVNLRRKEVSFDAAAETVRDYARWRVVENTVPLLEGALEEIRRWQLSFWDAMIIAAARRAGATTVWSEDMAVGQDYGGIAVVNPLA